MWKTFISRVREALKANYSSISEEKTEGRWLSGEDWNSKIKWKFETEQIPKENSLEVWNEKENAPALFIKSTINGKSDRYGVYDLRNNCVWLSEKIKFKGQVYSRILLDDSFSEGLYNELLYKQNGLNYTSDIKSLEVNDREDIIDAESTGDVFLGLIEMPFGDKNSEILIQPWKDNNSEAVYLALASKSSKDSGGEWNCEKAVFYNNWIAPNIEAWDTISLSKEEGEKLYKEMNSLRSSKINNLEARKHEKIKLE